MRVFLDFVAILLWRMILTIRERNCLRNVKLIDPRSLPKTQKLELSLAVHLHAYYHDVVPEIVESLKNIQHPYDLYVSVPNDAAKVAVANDISCLAYVKKRRIEVTENRGRDIAPMVCTFGRDLIKYDCMCHIHTKKTCNLEIGNFWRKYLLKSMFGEEPQYTKNILGFFGAEAKLGLVYPQYPFPNRWGYTWLPKFHMDTKWNEALKINCKGRHYFHFPAGSFFWARPKAIKEILESYISYNDFPDESMHIWHHLAHFLERAIGVVAKKNGYSIAIINTYLSDEFIFDLRRFYHFIKHLYFLAKQKHENG